MYQFSLVSSLVFFRPAMIHRCTGTSRYLLPRCEYRMLKKIFTIHLHMQQQTWESTVFNQCLALYSKWWTQQTCACFQLGLSAVQSSEPTSKTRSSTLLVLLLCNVSYRDNCIGICIVSWKNVLLQTQFACCLV